MTFTEQKFDNLHTLLLCTRISFAHQMQCQQIMWWRKILNILAYNLICMKVSNIGNNMKDDWIIAGKRNKWRNVSFSCEWFLIYCCVNIMMSFQGYYQKKEYEKANFSNPLFTQKAFIIFWIQFGCKRIRDCQIFYLASPIKEINLGAHLIWN